MDCLSARSTVKRVVMMSCTQIGKTEVGLNWIGYIMHHAPQPMLVVVPTLEVRKRWVRQRFDPMLQETTVLAELFNAKRRRDAANSEDMKDYPGGFCVIGGANSPASLASMPIGAVLADEVDRFPWEVGGEGDPLGLIDERTKTFPRRKVFLVSTPTMKDSSRIEEEYERSDQRRYQVACPHCQEYQVLKWANLKWNKAITKTIYVCEHCGCEIDEHYKTRMLAGGRWVPENPDSKIRGYHINGLYAPLGLGFTWNELATEFMRCQDDKAKLKRFINTTLGETWEDRSREVKANHLVERAEPFKLRQVPPGCLILTLGVDTQDDRLAVQLLGWGRGEVCFVLDWVELPGTPGLSPIWLDLIQPCLKLKRLKITDLLASVEPGLDFKTRLITGLRAAGCDRTWLQQRLGRRAADIADMAPAQWPGDVWLDLVQILVTPLVNSAGHELQIQAAAIDSGGHHTHDVYTFVRSAPTRRLMAIQGSNVPNKPILPGRPNAQDINWRGKVIKGGVSLWKIGTDTAKHVLFNRLVGDQQLDAAGRKVRFSADLPSEYFEQLVSESFDPEKNKWIKRRGRRNEALDTWVYACAASHHPQIRVHAMQPREWQRLEAALEPAKVDKTEVNKPAPKQDVPRSERFKRRNL
jgi:phage terminase large subunit GpA-like protein